MPDQLKDKFTKGVMGLLAPLYRHGLLEMIEEENPVFAQKFLEIQNEQEPLEEAQERFNQLLAVKDFIEARHKR